jgi:hypothetical protein
MAPSKFTQLPRFNTIGEDHQFHLEAFPWIVLSACEITQSQLISFHAS